MRISRICSQPLGMCARPYATTAALWKASALFTLRCWGPSTLPLHRENRHPSSNKNVKVRLSGTFQCRTSPSDLIVTVPETWTAVCFQVDLKKNGIQSCWDSHLKVCVAVFDELLSHIMPTVFIYLFFKNSVHQAVTFEYFRTVCCIYLIVSEGL